MLKEFTDAKGVRWRVWDVNPTVHERVSRRFKRTSLNIPEAWLCFESSDVRRRLWPVPSGWDAFDDDGLCALCAQAEDVPDAL